MKIMAGKEYKVCRYINHGNGEIEDREYGILPAEDVKTMVRGYKYDSDFDMWFTPKANISLDIQEVTR